MLVPLVARLVAVVVALLAVTSLVVIGRTRLVRTRYEFRERFAAVSPYVGLLAAVLVANKVARDVGPDISWIIGFRISGHLQRIDGRLLWPLYPEETPQVVDWLHGMATPELTAYFAFAYVYGYVFLLVFPLVAYFALPRPEPLRRTIVAYGTNYLIGVICYVIFIAYGPRNLVSEGLLYSHYAEFQFVTTAINDETNVFPSLHASLAVTAALLAWSTREEYPRWVPVAAVLAVSVVVSTVYLGIHWATDVVVGVALAWVSVRVGEHLEETPPTFGVGDRVRRVADAVPAWGRR